MSGDVPDHCAGDADYHADRVHADEERDDRVGALLRDAAELQREATVLGLPLVARALKVAIWMAEADYNKGD